MSQEPKPITDHQLDEALARYLAGEASVEEVARLREWAVARVGDAGTGMGERMLDALADLRDTDRRDAVEADEAALWRRLAERLELEKGPDTSRAPVAADRTRTGRRANGGRSGHSQGVVGGVQQRPTWDSWRPHRHTTFARLAIVALLVAGGAAMWLGSRHSPRPVARGEVAATQYTARHGQRLALRLSDGTRVVLAPGSTLKKSASYGSTERTLYLEGEAYFDVTHDAARAFTVRTSRAVVRDLGTRFDVRAYPTDTSTAVIVAQGKVVIAPSEADSFGSDSLLLVRGELGRVRSDGTLERTNGRPLERYLAWTEGRLVFHDTPLSEVVRQLVRWYDADVRLDDSALAARPLTASFDELPLTDVLSQIAGPLGLDVSRESGVYTFRRR